MAYIPELRALASGDRPNKVTLQTGEKGKGRSWEALWKRLRNGVPSRVHPEEIVAVCLLSRGAVACLGLLAGALVSTMPCQLCTACFLHRLEVCVEEFGALVCGCHWELFPAAAGGLRVGLGMRGSECLG